MLISVLKDKLEKCQADLFVTGMGGGGGGASCVTSQNDGCKRRLTFFTFTKVQSVLILSNFAHPYPFLAFLRFGFEVLFLIPALSSWQR